MRWSYKNGKVLVVVWCYNGDYFKFRLCQLGSVLITDLEIFEGIQVIFGDPQALFLPNVSLQDRLNET